MASYMPQRVFNMCAVTAVQYSITSEGVTVEEFARQVSDKYRRNYIDDGYEKDIVLAALKLTSFIESSFPGRKAATAVRQLQYCVNKFHPNGKRRFFSGGTIFNRQRSPLPNRVSQVLKDIVVFHTGSLSGSFPLAPRHWSL